MTYNDISDSMLRESAKRVRSAMLKSLPEPRQKRLVLGQHRIIPHKCKQGAHNEHIAEGNPSISFAMAH